MNPLTTVVGPGHNTRRNTEFVKTSRSKTSHQPKKQLDQKKPVIFLKKLSGCVAKSPPGYSSQIKNEVTYEARHKAASSQLLHSLLRISGAAMDFSMLLGGTW